MRISDGARQVLEERYAIVILDSFPRHPQIVPTETE